MNRGHACVKGRYAHGFVSSPERATEPMVRRDDDWQVVSWPDAIAVAVGGLRTVVDQFGPDAVGVLGSARATNEDNYLLQKFARTVIGTNNVDCCARVCHAPSAVGLASMLGTGAATNSFDDIEAAGSVLVCGSNTTENHPIVGERIKQAARRGTGLVVIDPRRIELADYADVFLQLDPGTNVLVLNAMAATIIEEELVDAEFVDARVDGVERYREFVTRFRPEQVAARCGLDPAAIRAAARLYAGGRPSMSVHGLGVTEHVQGTDTVRCLVNLALLTGNLGVPGGGVNPLRGQNNVQGAAHMGCEPAHLTGYAPLAESARFEEVWGEAVPTTPGLDAMAMLDAAAAGELRALWVVGWDLLADPTGHDRHRRGAGRSRSADRAGPVPQRDRGRPRHRLPAGLHRVREGRHLHERRAASPTCPPDRQAARRHPARLGDHLHGGAGIGGHDLFGFASPEQVWDEIRQVWPAGAGMTYDRLDSPGGLQWPCPTIDHPGTAILHTDSFGAARPDRDAGPGGLPSPAPSNPIASTPSCSSPAGASTSSTPAP